MSYTDKKITQEEINAHHVQGATDHLIGNAQQNKAVFDDLPEFIAGKHNELIDELNSHHGDEIKVAVDEWLAEHPEATTTVQDNSLTTAKYVDGSVTPAKLDRAYATPNDLSEVNTNLTTEINVLDARMDEFASLPEGSTTADAELVDIRVGADGKTYPSAGDSVRGQVADLKSDLINYEEYIIGKSDLTDSATWTEGYAIIADGSIVESSNVHYSSMIPVEQNLTYHLLTKNNGTETATIRIHGYSSDGTWVEQVDYASIAASEEKDIGFAVSNTNVKAIRISAPKKSAFMSLYYGDTFQKRLSDIEGGLYYITSPVVSWQLGELNSNGTVNVRPTGLRTSFMYLPKGTTIGIPTNGYKFNMARYSSADTSTFITGSYKSASSGAVLEVAEDGYVIVSIWHTNNTPFSDTSESEVVSIQNQDSLLKTLDYKTSPLFRNSIRFGKIPTSYYSGQLTDFSAEDLTRSTTTDEMIALFDTLVDGVYITKKDLGVCSDGVHHLYEYDMIPSQSDLLVSGLAYTPKTMPKFLITSAQHGFEKASVYGLYYFMRDVVDNWDKDETLAYFRNHMQIKIIPICNPYGFDNNSYFNYNGVNLNRNYDTPGFDGTATPGTSNYGGTVAGSEPETKIICNFINTNKDALFLIDFHTQGQYAVSEQKKINWLDFAPISDSMFCKFKFVAQTHLENISMHFAKEYSLTRNVIVGYVTSGEDGYTADFPSVDCWALQEGVCGHTTEGFCGFPNGATFTADVCKGNAEIIGNWMSSIINHYSLIMD